MSVFSDTVEAALPDAQIAAGNIRIDMETIDFCIEGRPCTWSVVDETVVDGQRFFLMQNQQFGSEAGCAVVDSRGMPAAGDTTEGFTGEVLQEIRQYIRRQEPAEFTIKVDSASPSKQTRTLAGTERQAVPQGQINPVKKRKQKFGKGAGPVHKRESVLKKLHEYEKLVRDRSERK